MPPSAPPPGDSVPDDGALPAPALAELGSRPFGCYVHVPFCTVRCGYCDFNTYTAAELGAAPGASRAAYADAVVAEVRLARRVLGSARDLPVETVFFGGGTPTLLDPADLGRVLAAIVGRVRPRRGRGGHHRGQPRQRHPGESRRGCEQAGFTRVSFGMQSAVPHVLATLDRTHDPRRVPDVVGWARAAGFDAGQPRPDLRHAGGVARRLGDLGGGGPGLRSPTTCRRTP